MTVKLTKLGNNLLEEMNRQWDCIVSENTCFEQIDFFSTVKKYGRHEVSSIKVLIFVSVFLFFLLVFFFFRGFSIISSVRYFFIGPYPFKNVCQMEVFVIFYVPKESLLNKQSISLCKVSKNHFLNAVFVQLF